MIGESMGETVPQRNNGKNRCFVITWRVVELDDFRDEFVTRFKMDLAEWGEAVRTRALRLKRIGNT